MKSIVSFPSLLSMLAAMGLASLAFAQHQEARGGEGEYRGRGEGVRFQTSRSGERSSLARGGHGDYAMSMAPQRRERLSLEERRQLRQDIDEAGRSIYRQGRDAHH